MTGTAALRTGADDEAAAEASAHAHAEGADVADFIALADADDVADAVMGRRNGAQWSPS